MARHPGPFLDSGDTFPRLEMDTVAHGRLVLPEHWGARHGVLLVYRAHW